MPEFLDKPRSARAPTDPNDLVNKAYADSVGVTRLPNGHFNASEPPDSYPLGVSIMYPGGASGWPFSNIAFVVTEKAVVNGLTIATQRVGSLISSEVQARSGFGAPASWNTFINLGGGEDLPSDWVTHLTTNSKSASDGISTYVSGISIEYSSSGGGWPTNVGVIVTTRSSSITSRGGQVYYASTGEVFYRAAITATTWGAWTGGRGQTRSLNANAVYASDQPNTFTLHSVTLCRITLSSRGFPETSGLVITEVGDTSAVASQRFAAASGITYTRAAASGSWGAWTSDDPGLWTNLSNRPGNAVSEGWQGRLLPGNRVEMRGWQTGFTLINPNQQTWTNVLPAAFRPTNDRYVACAFSGGASQPSGWAGRVGFLPNGSVTIHHGSLSPSGATLDGVVYSL